MRHSRQIKFVIGGLVVALTIGYLIFSAASGAAYYVTIDELEQGGSSRRNVRVLGQVVGESIAWEPRELRLEFDIVDESGRLSVLYHGQRPDMLRDRVEVVVEGRLVDSVFEARAMVLKCPSKYQEAQ